MKKPLLSTLLTNYEQKSMLLSYELSLINEVIEPVIDTKLAYDETGDVILIEKGTPKHFNSAEEIVSHLKHLIYEYNDKHGIDNEDYVYEKYIDSKGVERRKVKYTIETDEKGNVLRKYRMRNFANILRSSNR